MPLIDQGFIFAIAHIRGGQDLEGIGMIKVECSIRWILSLISLIVQKNF